MDTVLVREHQCVLTVGIMVFVNPLLSYNHKDDLLDIVVALGLDHTGTMAVLTECIQTHLASHSDVTLTALLLWPDKKLASCANAHTDMDAPSQDQGGPSASN